MREAGDRITSARWLFRSLCGGDKDTSKKGSTIGKLIAEHLVGSDIRKEEDVDKLDRAVAQANCRGIQEYGRLMQVWDIWNDATAKEGFTFNEVDGKAAVFAGILTWGVTDAAREGTKPVKF